MRDTMIFYRSFYEAVKDLPIDEQGKIYNAIFNYSLNFKEDKLTGVSKAVWTLIKPQLDANIKRYQNGTKPKQSKSKTEANTKQKISKVEANKNNNDIIITNNIIYRSFNHLSITQEQFNKLELEYSKEQIDEVLDAIENFSGNKKYKSLYLTVKNWIKDKPKKNELKDDLVFNVMNKIK